MTDVSSFRHKKRREAPLFHVTTSHLLHGNSIPNFGCHYFLILACTTAFPSTPYLLCCNKIWFIDFIKSLVVFTLVGLWFIHFLLSLVTYRQPMPLQLCDVSHYRLVQSWMWEILLHGHILSLGTWSCSYPYFLALEVSYPPSPIHQSCFRSWGCLLATIIYSLGESSLSLSLPLSKLFCVENLPWELCGQLPVASSFTYNLDSSAVCFKVSSLTQANLSHSLCVCVFCVCASGEGRIILWPLRLEFLQWFIWSLKISSLRRFLFLFWGFGRRVVCVVNFA